MNNEAALLAAGAAMLLLSYFYQRGVSKNTPPPPQEQKPVSTPPRNQDPVMPTPGTNQPRGIRNNNPLNMRDYGINWRGNIGRDAQGFEVFDTPQNGIRAAGNDLKNKWINGTRTIKEIISIWAPASGQAQSGAVYMNPTEAYIDFVSKKSGIPAEKTLIDFEDYVKVVTAMIQKENGQQPYSNALIRAALLDGFTSGKALPVYFGGLV